MNITEIVVSLFAAAFTVVLTMAVIAYNCAKHRHLYFEELMQIRRERAQLKDFVRDCRDNWDCDSDGHKNQTGCRACEAKRLLEDVE